MRNLKVALLAVGTIISLLSLRDNGVVTTAPNAKPLVAEAYHSPQDMRLPPLTTGTAPLVVPPPSVRNHPQPLLTGSPSVDSSEYDFPSQNRGAGTNEPANFANANTAPAAPIGKSTTNSGPPSASLPTTIIYGLASVGSPSSGNDNNASSGGGGISGSSISSNNSGGAGGTIPSPQSNTNNVLITNLVPNSGVPGTNIIIQGAGFDSAASNNIVKLGSVSAVSVSYVSKNQLRAVIPQGLSAGFTNLSVSVRGAASNSFLFDILKDVSGNIFIDDTQNILPAGMTLTDSSIIRLGDLNNDSDLDLLVVDKSAGTVYLLINNGHGAFSNETSSRLPAIINPSFITDTIFGDINQDNYVDIILAYSSGQSVRLLLNDGRGNFNDATGANLPNVSGSAVSMDLGDANGDGMLDIVIANSDARDILLVNGSAGVFAVDTNFNLPEVIDGSSDIRFCDINGDGNLDIITTNNEVVGASSLSARAYINDGQGHFTDNMENILPNGSEYTEAFDYGDIDGDGDVDIIAANYNQNAVLINNGSGVLEDQAAERIPANGFASKDTKLGDINGDGYLDIAMLGEDKMSLLINDGHGFFTEDSIKLPDYRSAPAVLGGKSVQVSDINGDGSLDIIVGGGIFRILMNTAANKPPVLDRIGNKTVAAGKNLTFNVAAQDPNGDALTFLAGNLPVGAAFISKVFNWIPKSADIGQYKNIRFIARENTPDALEGSEDITITVTGSGLPVIDHYLPNDLSQNLTLGQITQFGVSAKDPDDGPLIFKWFLNGREISADSGATASFIFIVPRIGENTVEVKVSNGVGSVSVQWNLSVGVTQNRPPVISAFSPDRFDINIDLTSGGALNFGITASDPDIDLLTYSWKFDGNAVSDTPNLNSSAYAAYLAAGSHTVEVSVTDGKSAPVIHQWALHITQNNRAPVIATHSPNQSDIIIDMSAGGAINFGVIAADADSDQLTYSWKFDANILSTTANLNSAAYAAYASIGAHMVEVSVTDGKSAPVTHQWALHITQTDSNHPPTIDSHLPLDTPIDLIVGNSQTFGISASDADSSDTLTYNWSVNGAPTGANSNSYGYSANQAGQFTVKVTVSDGKATTLPEHVWTVNVNTHDVQRILNDIINHAFNYFWRETDNPATGFVRDRLLVNGDPTTDPHYEKASMAATGFGLSAMCVAAKKYGDGSDPDWQVSPEDLAARVELILDTLLRIQSNQSPDGDATWGKSGFFYHFVNINTGENWPNVEVSSIDTAILVAGALTAGEYFKDVNQNISSKANQLYANVDWNSFVDYTSNDHYGQFYKQWMTGGQGHNNGHWDYNDESTLLYLLAIGSPVPEHAVNPDLYYSMRRELGSYGTDGKAIVRTWFGSLFAYQYTNAFFDLRNMHDARNVDWWQNAVHATIANRQFCMDQDNAGAYGYGRNVWGLSSAYKTGATYVGEYGASPTGSPNGPTHDGTVNPNVAASAIGMLPAEVGETIASMKNDPNLWRQDTYGFINSFKNSDPRVYSDYFVGLDLGASLVMSANHTDSGLIWNNFMNAQTRYGTMRDLLDQLNFHSNSDSKLYIDVDDITPKSQFAYGSIDSANTTSQVSFNLIDIVPNSKYILAIHTFMNNFAGDYQVILNVNANGNDEGNQAISHVTDKSDDIKYIEVDSSHLQPGENVITLTWQSGAGWVAWKNLEISSPVTNNEWTITRSMFATEHRLDDTYYTGHADKYGAIAYKTFEQALNSAVDPYTDILFYIDDLDHDRKFTLMPHDSNGAVHVNITVNGQLSSENTLINGQQQQVIISASLLKAGWNRVRLTITNQGGEWIIWDSLKLELGDSAMIEAPHGFIAASFGKSASKLRWNSANLADKYNLYRSTTKGGPYTIVDEVSAPAASYTNTGLLDNTVYYYVVRAVKADSTESQNSQEAAVSTGSYQLDYGDGRSPNVFGQDTFDNAGSPLGDNAFRQLTRYNGLPGKVRIFNLASSQKNTIGLNNANINDATMFSFRVKGEIGGEKFQIRLKDNTGAQASVSLEISQGGIWQEMHFNMADTFAGIDLTNMQNMEVVSQTTLGQITFYFDEAEFATVGLVGDKLDVKIRNGADDGLATGVDFGATTAENGPVLSNQYIEINYVSSGSWGIQIFTDNKAEDARPRFTGTGDRANGLVGMMDSGYRVPVLWQVWQEKKGYYNGAETPEFDTTDNDGDRAEFAFIVDKGDSDWSVPFARNYRTLIDHDGLLGAPVPLAVPPPGFWPLQGKVGQPIYVYLAADFTGSPAQQYTTSKLIIDIYHE